MPPPDATDPRREVDPAALAHQLRRLYRLDQPPWLHAEVARRMAERLPVIRVQPARVLDWHARLSASQALLRHQYPKAAYVAVDALTAPPAPPAPRRWWQRAAAAPPSLRPEDAPPGQADLLWANMVVHAEADPPALFARWHDAIAVDGFLMFSTLGPGSFVELSALYRRLGWPPPLAPLVDMHDLGDMLVAAGFADPVMDQETLTLSWPGPAELLAELRTLGGNVHRSRHGALRSRAWRQRLGADLLTLAAPPGGAPADARPRLSVEVVYGHAFRAAPRLKVAAETTVSPETLRTMARQGRRGGPTGR
jgi:malonyl-CoA O-methyltransferase